MIKAFFFDLDGTLVETHRANFEAYRRALSDMGVALGFEDFKSTIGQQAREFLPRLAPDLTAEQLVTVGNLKAEYYRDLMHTSRANDQLIRFMRNVKRDHVIALVTTAKRRNLDAVLAHHGLGDEFDLIVSAEDVMRAKPDPEAYLLALKRTGLLPSEVVAFEDSDSGLMAAEAAGIAVIAINDFSL